MCRLSPPRPSMCVPARNRAAARKARFAFPRSFRNDAVTGHRPTWPLGKRAARLHNSLNDFQFEGAFGGEERAEPQSPRRPERQVTRLQLTAFDTLQLEPSATLNEIKARYKELVKRFHPDANGGDRGAEERLKQVIKAYGVLRASGLT